MNEETEQWLDEIDRQLDKLPADTPYKVKRKFVRDALHKKIHELEGLKWRTGE